MLAPNLELVGWKPPSPMVLSPFEDIMLSEISPSQRDKTV